MSDMSKDVLKVVKKKTGKNISQKEINKLAKGVKPSTVQSEAQLRKLIKQVSSMVNVKVTEETVNDIIKAVKGSGVDPNNMQQLMQMMMGKKK